MEKIKVFEAFAGYGSQHLALKRLKRDCPDFDYEVVGISEIDKYAIQAYNALHPNVPNYGDISKIDWSQVPDFDLFTYSFPCTDISSSGLQQGFEEGSGTRSSLLWECRKAIVAKRPKYLLLENVKALVSKKFLPLFNKWIKSLEDYGYYNNWSVLDTKDFGVPQHRERVFLMSIRRDVLDPSPTYAFPKPFRLNKRLNDILERGTDEKYYLNGKKLKGFTVQVPINTDSDGCCRTIQAQYYKTGKSNFNRRGGYGATGVAVLNSDISIVQLGNIYPDTDTFHNRTAGRVYDINGISPTIRTPSGGGVIPQIVVEDTFKAVSYSRDKDGKIINRHLKDVFNTVHTSTGCGGNTDCFVAEPNITGYRIRKLTPREVFRLQGVSDTDIDILQGVSISNTQLYKLAGNSITVDVLYYVFRNLFIDKHIEAQQCKLNL